VKPELGEEGRGLLRRVRACWLIKRVSVSSDFIESLIAEGHAYLREVTKEIGERGWREIARERLREGEVERLRLKKVFVVEERLKKVLVMEEERLEVEAR
jgi:hypothetical protein